MKTNKVIIYLIGLIVVVAVALIATGNNPFATSSPGTATHPASTVAPAATEAQPAAATEAKPAAKKPTSTNPDDWEEEGC